MEDTFPQLLESLSNAGEPMEPARLSELSDLDQKHLDRFTATWRELAEDARQELLEHLGALADAQIELTFESINRMAVTDAASGVRVQAIENLWESEDPALAERFLAALEGDPSEQVRSAAAKALGAFVLLGETRGLPTGVSDSVESGLLRANRSDPSATVRNRSLESLGFSSRAEVTILIEDAFHSESEAQLLSALRAMARSANPRWTEHVVSRLHDPSPGVRLEAARAAGEVEAHHGVAELVELIDDVDDRVRRAAIWSIGQLGGSIAAETLTNLISGAEDEAEAELLQDALDNMDFIQSTRELLRYESDGLEGSAD